MVLLVPHAPLDSDSSASSSSMTSTVTSSSSGPTSVEDTAAMGAWVWIVLFGCVMAASLLANVTLCALVAANKAKHKLVYLLLVSLSLVEACEYALLAFEFSLGVGHQFAFGQTACVLYQMAARNNPIMHASVVVILLMHTVSEYTTVSEVNAYVNAWRAHAAKLSSGLSVVYRPVSSSSMGVSGRRGQLLLLSGVVLTLLLCWSAFSIPTAYLARIVRVESALPESAEGAVAAVETYCEVDASALVRSQRWQQAVVSAYYLVYSATLAYWMPLALSIPCMIRLLRYRSRTTTATSSSSLSAGDKSPEVSVALAAAASFFVLYSGHAVVVTLRHGLDAAGFRVDTHQSWMLKVAQSLFLLVAYFWHFARPALVVLLDADLKFALWSWADSCKTALCCHVSAAHVVVKNNNSNNSNNKEEREECLC